MALLLPFGLVLSLLCSLPVNAYHDFSRSSLLSSLSGSGLSARSDLAKRNSINYNPDGSPFLWLPVDEYKGKTFYDRFNFFSEKDPTNGHVKYVDRKTAFDKGYVWVADNGTVFMKSDDASQLEHGTYRESVRIETATIYNTGLFVLDLNKAPWGCGIWPAFWTVSGNNWPYNGEIDIIEGVHDNEHNQVAWHTGPGCELDPNSTFTGNVVHQMDCNGLINGNAGCGITEWSRASYGPYFEAQGGGVFVMKWDEVDISVWSFYRAAIPKDLLAGSPNPSEWGTPSARLASSKCDIKKNFSNHTVVFDITFCGDWAGNSYATSGCPGTCEERLMNPQNFENATWSINSLKVYRKQLIAGNSTKTNSATSTSVTWNLSGRNFYLLFATVLLGLLF